MRSFNNRELKGIKEMQTHVVLVDEQDQVLGTAEKLVAHQQGLLHRAFSVFIYRKKNNQREILLQQRNPAKYHSGGLWTNTCCSHPMPDETILEAAKRRLMEEMGIQAELTTIGKFHYTASVGNDLIENELDHVLVGEMLSENIQVNPDEVADYCWIEINELQSAIKQNPERYTAWLEKALVVFVGFVA